MYWLKDKVVYRDIQSFVSLEENYVFAFLVLFKPLFTLVLCYDSYVVPFFRYYSVLLSLSSNILPLALRYCFSALPSSPIPPPALLPPLAAELGAHSGIHCS